MSPRVVRNLCPSLPIFRLGKQLDNPPPGTVLDHTVTKRNWYDFFLVSQHVGQGTVSPTHYVVIQDSLGLPVDAVQRIRWVCLVVN